MFTKILVTKAKINTFMYQDTERESHALCRTCSLHYDSKPDSNTCQYRDNSGNHHQDLPHSALQSLD